MNNVRECECEDYPCCGHTDNYPEDDFRYCDVCGLEHFGECRYAPFDLEDDEDS